MSKIITVSQGGKKYELTFTRETVMALERSGFSIDDVVIKPVISVPMLFRGSLVAKNPKMPVAEADALWAQIKKKDQLVLRLSVIYKDVVESLFADPEEDDEKNATWETNF